MQRYFAKNKKDNYLILEESDIHHIKTVMRMNSNDNIECVFEEKLYICSVDNPNENKFKIIKQLNESNELTKNITVCIGLVKEQKMDLILQKLTELGVSKIIPVSMERSIVKLDKEKFKKKKKRWETICKEASEQSKRTVIPQIGELINIKELNNIEGELKLVCSTKEKSNLINKYLQKNNKCATIVFVIGPEGGISDKEEELLNSFGYISVSLGNLIMRVETAAIYVGSIMNYCNME